MINTLFKGVLWSFLSRFPHCTKPSDGTFLKNFYGKLNSFEFCNQCMVENISGCEKMVDSPSPNVWGSESYMRGNSLCLRSLQGGRLDDIYSPIKHQRVTVLENVGSSQKSGDSCFGKNCCKSKSPYSVVFKSKAFGRRERTLWICSLLFGELAALYFNKENFPYAF